MSPTDAYKLTISESSRLIRENKLTPLQLLESLLKRIDKLEPKLEAWVRIDRKKAIATADKRSREAAKGKIRGPLHGIPIGVKDIFYTKEIKTTAGSKILADFMPGYDASTVAKLKEAGAIILGKTETTEFASFDPAPTRNPWNVNHTPGGSSSGSAAAVSSGMCQAALGSQTGGSTIRPAAYCGIVGLKPTYGRISRYGVFPLSWSLDHVGIFTRTVEDAAILLEVLSGYDPKDDSTSTLPVPPYRNAINSLSPPRIGFLKEFFYCNATKEIRKNLEAVTNRIGETGAEIVEMKLPESFSVVHAAHKIIVILEAMAIHQETFRTRMMDYSPILRGMIASGFFVSASTYVKAQRIRRKFIGEIATILEHLDCLLTPATNIPAPKGLKSTGDNAFNSPWSFCGFPSITIPSGLTKNRLPLGIQLVGHPFDEKRLLSMARWCEKIIVFGHKPHDPV